MIYVRRKGFRFGAIAAGLLMLLTASASSSTSAASAGSGVPPHLTGADVVRYATATGSTRIHQGKRQPGGGCSFSLDGTVGPAGSGSQLTEVAYNSKTCQTEIEVGAPATGGSETSTGSESSGGGSAGTDKPAAGGIAPAYGGGASCVNPFASNSYYPREACIHSWMQDPIQIRVTEITNEVQWTPSGGCATAGPEYASYYEQRFVPSGWFLLGNSWQPSFTCQAVKSQSGVLWQNNLFCANTPTSVTIAQFIKGLPGGGYTWSVNWTKTGVCSLLLSFVSTTSP